MCTSGQNWSGSDEDISLETPAVRSSYCLITCLISNLRVHILADVIPRFLEQPNPSFVFVRDAGHDPGWINTQGL